MNAKTIIGVVAVAVLVGGVSFYSGMQYDKGVSRFEGGNFASQRGQFGGGMGGGMMRGNRTGGGPMAGEIIAKDDKSLTIKSLDGSSRIVFYSEETITTKSVSSSVSALSIGEQITILGTSNNDGSLIAQSIQVRPAGIHGFSGVSSTRQ